MSNLDSTINFGIFTRDSNSSGTSASSPSQQFHAAQNCDDDRSYPYTRCTNRNPGIPAVIVPSCGLNYEYWLNHQWAVGIHSDMEIATYIIENHESTEIERERPIIISTVGVFKPVHQIVLIAGIGREIETHENLWVARFGIDYEFELRDGWDLSPSLIYDIKESLYDSWTLGLSVGKRL